MTFLLATASIRAMADEPTGTAAAGKSLSWHHRYDIARAEATRTGRNIMILFTGSDWCPPCRSLEKNVFQDPDFIRHAGKRWVLLELDFPRRKPQSHAIRQQNARLLRRFGVRGYPTVVFANPQGQMIAGLSGYSDQKPREYFTRLTEVESKYAGGEKVSKPAARPDR
jgi:thiol:disulfide interchange protein